jgi:myosin heavy subunit
MSAPSYSVGDRVWVPHEEHAWLAGRIASLTPSLEVKTEHHGIIKLKSSQLKTLEPCGSHVDQAVENLVDLDELSEGAILHHVRKRFINKKIYTSVGSILVATNPFENL